MFAGGPIHQCDDEDTNQSMQHCTGELGRRAGRYYSARRIALTSAIIAAHDALMCWSREGRRPARTSLWHRNGDE